VSGDGSGLVSTMQTGSLMALNPREVDHALGGAEGVHGPGDLSLHVLRF
jgi:hypothetical protein